MSVILGVRDAIIWMKHGLQKNEARLPGPENEKVLNF